MKPMQFPGVISKVSTMSQCIRLHIDTQDTLSDEQIAYLFQKTNKLGWFTFNVSQIENEDIVKLPPLKRSDNKTPSQRMRAVIYIIWEQEKSDKGFNAYYEWYMESIIEKLKERLD